METHETKRDGVCGKYWGIHWNDHPHTQSSEAALHITAGCLWYLAPSLPHMQYPKLTPCFQSLGKELEHLGPASPAGDHYMPIDFLFKNANRVKGSLRAWAEVRTIDPCVPNHSLLREDALSIIVSPEWTPCQSQSPQRGRHVDHIVL